MIKEASQSYIIRDKLFYNKKFFVAWLISLIFCFIGILMVFAGKVSMVVYLSIAFFGALAFVPFLLNRSFRVSEQGIYNFKTSLFIAWDEVIIHDFPAKDKNGKDMYRIEFSYINPEKSDLFLAYRSQHGCDFWIDIRHTTDSSEYIYQRVMDYYQHSHKS
ncbi:MAG: hypothetical protein ACK5MJ_03430 [Alphaproteobacteria bacterium]